MFAFSNLFFKKNLTIKNFFIRSVVVNGAVEHLHSNGETTIYRLGDCFGAEPTSIVRYQEGDMRTLVDDCEFVLVEHSDYCSIMSTLSDHIEREEDEQGEVLREAERRLYFFLKFFKIFIF